MATTRYYQKSPEDERNGASECVYATHGEKGTEDHMKMAIESWLSEKNKFSWDASPLKGNNYTNVMWKASQMSK